MLSFTIHRKCLGSILIVGETTFTVICGKLRCSCLVGARLTRDLEPGSSEHTSYITVLAFFFQMFAPDLRHWVRGSGRNPVACVFLARLCKAQNGFQAGEGGTWRAVKAWASAVTPALPGPDPRCSSSDPPPWTPTPRGCNLGVPCHRTSGGPGRKRLELLKRKGGNSVHEKKRKLFMRWADVWMEE